MFNKLTPAEAERLFILSEECGEVVQAIGKILRHGYESKYSNGITNREQLEIEIADVTLMIEFLIDNKDISVSNLEDATHNKLQRIDNYLHHNKYWQYKDE